MAEEAAQRWPRWTLQQWYDDIDSKVFDRDRMNDATRIWREQIFPCEMEERTVQKLKDAPTAKARREIKRRAFRAWQKEKYGHATLAKCFLKYPAVKYHELLQEWHSYTLTPEYQEAREKHLPRDLRTQVSCSPQTNEASGSEGEAVPATSAPLRGRGSNHWHRLEQLRQQRKAASKGRADPATMQWFCSGGLDKELERLTKENGSGRYYDQQGNAVDLHPYAFEDHLTTQHY